MVELLSDGLHPIISVRASIVSVVDHRIKLWRHDALRYVVGVTRYRVRGTAQHVQIDAVGHSAPLNLVLLDSAIHNLQFVFINQLIKSYRFES